MKVLVFVLALSTAAQAQEYIKGECAKVREAQKYNIEANIKLDQIEAEFKANEANYKPLFPKKQKEMEALVQNIYENSKPMKDYLSEATVLTPEQFKVFKSTLQNRLEMELSEGLKISAKSRVPSDYSYQTSFKSIFIASELQLGSMSVRVSTNSYLYFIQDKPVLVIGTYTWGPGGNYMTSGYKFVDLISKQELQQIDATNLRYGGETVKTELTEAVTGEIKDQRALRAIRPETLKFLEACNSLKN